MFQADHAQHILVNDLDALPFLLQLLEHHMMAANGSPTSVPHWPSIRAILGLVSELSCHTHAKLQQDQKVFL